MTGLAIAGLALTAAHYTGNPIWDPIGSIVVGNLLGAVSMVLFIDYWLLAFALRRSCYGFINPCEINNRIG